MPVDSIEFNFLSIFTFISFFVFFVIEKVFKNTTGVLLDKDFVKPQAFHKNAVPRVGGLASILALTIFIVTYSFLLDQSLIDYLLISIAFFSLGFLDDIKVKIKPSSRLIIMIIVLLLSTNYFSINIENTHLNFLNILLKEKIFQVIFTVLCFLFIINGSNLIDGFNGLLGIHLITINLILLFINLIYGESQLAIIITGQLIVLASFVLFNFPKSKIFFGDSGSYLFGSLVALNVIKTNNLNPEVSSFFFCILLFYLFFEVFFSFFRKLYQKKSPLNPDQNHLHMLSFKFLKKIGKFKDCNYINSLLINLTFIILIIPSIYFKNDGILCRYWFFFLLALYIFFYLRLYSFAKKQFDI